MKTIHFFGMTVIVCNLQLINTNKPIFRVILHPIYSFSRDAAAILFVKCCLKKTWKVVCDLVSSVLNSGCVSHCSGVGEQRTRAKQTLNPNSADVCLRELLENVNGLCRSVRTTRQLRSTWRDQFSLVTWLLNAMLSPSAAQPNGQTSLAPVFSHAFLWEQNGF